MPWFPDTPPDGFKTIMTPDGEPIYIHSSVRLQGRIDMGRFSYIFRGGTLAAHLPIRIGKFTSIGANFWCSSLEDHHSEFASTYPFQDVLGMEMGYPSVKEPRRPYVSIGSDVWIGNDVRVMAGTVVGDGCILGAKALVSSDCEPYGIYGGIPAKLIRYRFPEEMRKQLLEIQWWEWPLEKIQANTHFFSINLNTFSGDLQAEIV